MLNKMIKLFFHLYLLGLLLLFPALSGLITGYAQGTQLLLKSVDSSSINLKSLDIKTQFTNQLQCRQYIQQLPGQLQASGYLAASIDSICEIKDTVTIHLFLGKKYKWNHISVHDKDKPLLHSLGITDDWYQSKPLNIPQINTIQNKLLNYFLANGHPFATIQFDSVHINNDLVDAQLTIKRGIPYRLDSIRVWGTAKIDLDFLYHYLDMYEESLFDIDKLNRINQLLQQLPYLQQTKEWTLTMLGGSFLLNLFLEPKKSNQINVIAGFLPANTQAGGKLLFTGEANVHLKNIFGKGETLGLDWQQLQASSPRLNIIYQKPYLFNTPYGADFSLDMYKKDSSYLNLTTKVGVQYLAKPKQTGTISLQLFSSTLLTVDTMSVIANKQLPTVADVSNISIVLQHRIDNTNYSPNPMRGSVTEMMVAVGNKKVKKNNTILNIVGEGFNYAKLYDTIQLNSYQISARGAFAHYFSVGKQSVIKTGASGGWMESPNYFSNELFQIGGYKLLRGFNEGSIFADKYAVATLEYRYLLGINSWFNVFSDAGFTHNSIYQINHQYIGVGLGLAFEAKQGIINISLAAGKRNDLPFNFNESKIHIGFVSVF